ncbi:class D sortase [Pseudoneobacillus sp. C159]
MKYISFLLVLAGLVLVTLGGTEFSQTFVAQKKSMDEAHEVINRANKSKLTFGKQIQNGDVVGILKFPSINEELAIIEGTDEDDLEKGVGHYKGSSFPNEKGQIVLSGHRDTVFRRLGELNLGDILTITLPNGTFSYQIEDTKIVEANDLSVITLQKQFEVLILTTCYPFSYIGNAPQRYIITAKPVDPPSN